MTKFSLALIIILLSAAPAFAQNTKITPGDLKGVQSSADSFSGKKVLGGIEYFEARRDKDLIGYCISVTGSGYCGPMRIIVGIDRSGVIQGVKILEHVETAGIGSGITERSFLDQFKGKNAAALSVGKNIDAITGATISSKAVIDLINDTAKRFIHLRNQREIE